MVLSTMKSQIKAELFDYDVSRRNHQFYILTPPNSGKLLASKATNGTLPGTSTKNIEVVDCDLIVSSGLDEPKNYIKLINMREEQGRRYTSQLLVNRYSDRLLVREGPNRPEKTYMSSCRYDSEPPRCKQSIYLAPPAMTPVKFRESIVVISDCTKKNYRSTLDCAPRYRPQRACETRYLRPKHLQTTYVTQVDYGSKVNYRSSVEVTPRSFCNNYVRAFEFNNDSGEGSSDWSEDDDTDDDWSSVDMAGEGEWPMARVQCAGNDDMHRLKFY